jgi:pilus assembly protein Flp/PilA
MKTFKLFISGFFQNQNGATAVEYGLIVAMVAIGIIGGLTAVSSGINNTFNTVGNSIKVN